MAVISEETAKSLVAWATKEKEYNEWVVNSYTEKALRAREEVRKFELILNQLTQS